MTAEIKDRRFQTADPSGADIPVRRWRRRLTRTRTRVSALRADCSASLRPSNQLVTGISLEEGRGWVLVSTARYDDHRS